MNIFKTLYYYILNNLETEQHGFTNQEKSKNYLDLVSLNLPFYAFFEKRIFKRFSG